MLFFTAFQNLIQNYQKKISHKFLFFNGFTQTPVPPKQPESAKGLSTNYFCQI